MADVTGPISSLPGTLHNLPAGQMCDLHPDRPAVKRAQGETDSMGCEMNDMCDECYKQCRADNNTTTGTCDWCKTNSVILKPRRDYDEGLSGPVYMVCDPCRAKQMVRLMEEMDRENGATEMDDYYDKFADMYDN